jgi:hypothetical protein
MGSEIMQVNVRRFSYKIIHESQLWPASLPIVTLGIACILKNLFLNTPDITFFQVSQIVFPFYSHLFRIKSY